jgi:hypothetical protein
MFQGCDVENIEDIANGSVSLKSLAKSKSNDRHKQQNMQKFATPETLASGVSKQPSMARQKYLSPIKGADKKTGPRQLKDFSAGLEILKIHQSFAAVSSKVTVSVCLR